MAHLSDDQLRDIEMLQELMDFLRAFFSWLIYESKVINQEFNDQFAQVFEIVQVRLKDAYYDLDDVKTDQDPVWKGLEKAGLTSAPLQLKLSLGRWAYAQARPQTAAPSPRGFKGKMLEPILSWMNSFLGSFASAVPGIEFVKEYKDGTELVLNHQAEGNEPPPSIFPS